GGTRARFVSAQERLSAMPRFVHLFLALAFVALGLSVAPGAQAVTRGGTLLYARGADSRFLDPVLTDRSVDIWILTNLYDTLLRPTPDGKAVVPALGSASQVSDDGRTVTVALRPGIQFADGSPITAADVKWSLDRARNPENGVWSFTLASIESIEAPAADSV